MRSKRQPALLEALFPLAIMIVLLLVGGRSMDLGPSLLVPVMLTAAAVAGFTARRQGASFGEIQDNTAEKVKGVMPVLLILLAIGMLVGTWMLGGTIPYMIYIGLQLVDPRFLLLTAFLVTAVMSLATGTSWGSAGTVGVALMGMAAALGVPLPAAAGAVLSGAYFGDKLSPLSDTTNISAIGAGSDLYDHIGHMMYTSIPSFILSCIVFLIAGMVLIPEGAETTAAATRLIREIPEIFKMSPWVLLPPAVVLLGVIRKTPPLLAMTASSVVAMLLGILLHGFSLPQALEAAVNGFSIQMLEVLRLDPDQFSDALHTLVNRGGLYSMVGNFVMILSAFLLAGAMDVSGALDAIIHTMLHAAKSIFGLISATMASGAIMIGLTSHGGVTALVIGGLFQNAYRERGLAPRNLSRSLEDSVTITEPLMPWTVSAIFMAATLGVPTMEYLPWAVFCYGGPIFSLFIAATYQRTGFGIKKLEG